jgi:hypothetical protein
MRKHEVAFRSFAGSMREMVDQEGYALFPGEAVACDQNRVILNGPYKTGVGYAYLSADYLQRLRDVTNAMARLKGDFNKVSAKVADAKVHKRRVDPATEKLLTATYETLTSIDNVFQDFSSAANRLKLLNDDVARSVNSPACNPSATPSPKPAGTPVPMATPSPKPATPKPGATPPPPTTFCKGGWQWWPGFGWRCVG